MDLSNPTGLLALLQTQGYLILFLLMFLEGPIITYVAAFAASLGFFNVFIVWILAIVSKFLGDLIFFLIGRLGKSSVIKRYIIRSIGPARVRKIERYLKNHPGKTLTVIKLVPPLPLPGIILCGAAGMQLRKFLFYSFMINFSAFTVFTVLGFYSGAAFVSIAKYLHYGQFIVGALIVLLLAAWLIIRLLSKKISKKIEDI